MTDVHGYDNWKLASPPETNGPERCRDCRDELDMNERKEGICAPCIRLRIEDDRA